MGEFLTPLALENDTNSMQRNRFLVNAGPLIVTVRTIMEVQLSDYKLTAVSQANNQN